MGRRRVANPRIEEQEARPHSRGGQPALLFDGHSFTEEDVCRQYF